MMKYAFLFLTLVLGGCHHSQNLTSPKPSEQPAWSASQQPTNPPMSQSAPQADLDQNSLAFLRQPFRLVKAEGVNAQKINAALANQKVSIDLSNLPKGYAYMGCNHINFSVALDDSRFKISQVSSTRMLCPTINALEMTLAKEVQAIGFYQIADGALVLYSNQSRLHFVPERKS